MNHTRPVGRRRHRREQALNGRSLIRMHAYAKVLDVVPLSPTCDRVLAHSPLWLQEYEVNELGAGHWDNPSAAILRENLPHSFKR